MPSTDLDFARLMSLVATLPEGQRTRLLQLIEETRERYDRIRRAHQLAMDALDDWRLYMKYQLFDLEARRRELQEDAHDQVDDQAVDWDE